MELKDYAIWWTYGKKRVLRHIKDYYRKDGDMVFIDKNDKEKIVNWNHVAMIEEEVEPELSAIYPKVVDGKLERNRNRGG